MYLSKLTISGFRQFGQGDAAAELTFQPGVTALIGTNDSGKTAIIDAVFTGQVSAVQKKLHFAYDFCHQFSLCFQPQSLIVMTASDAAKGRHPDTQIISKLFAIKTTAERDRHRILPKFVRSLQSCSQSPLLQ
jgi:predicted ATP-dependent endonuclease of OLD family